MNNNATVTGFASNPSNVKDIDIPCRIGPNYMAVSIGMRAFENAALTSVMLSNCIYDIEEYSFNNCKLSSIMLPAGVKTVGKFSFANNNMMTKFTLLGDAPIIYGNGSAGTESVFLNNNLVKVMANQMASGYGEYNEQTGIFYTDKTFTTPQLWAGKIVYGIPPPSICFIGSTPIVTDQGILPVDKIDPDLYTIEGKPIVAITRTIVKKKDGMYLVHIEKNALGPNLPIDAMTLTYNHIIQHLGKRLYASDLIGKYKKVRRLPYKGEMLYNIALHKHSFIKVNGLYIETLHPKNPIIQHFITPKKQEKKQEKKRINMCIA